VELVTLIASLAPPPARLLEVGCGDGELARALDASGYRVVAIDPRAPDGPIFRRITLEAFEADAPFDVVVACFSLHHLHQLEGGLDRVVALLEPGGLLVLEEFGWERLDHPTAAWYARERGAAPLDAVLTEWRDEHHDLHGYEDMRRALDPRFDEQAFAWLPHLHRYLDDGAEARERDAIARDEIRALGFRYVGTTPKSQ
jgi:ubiquinone/menaquinone biosynthesis C-methylase UbiE